MPKKRDQKQAVFDEFGALSGVKDAFGQLRFQNDAVKELAELALSRLEDAVVAGDNKVEEEWFDRCMKIAMSAPTRTKDEKMKRVKALADRRRIAIG
jgi:dTDP-4-dehydrorhamnose reductase|tara:strand:- start:3272 stop:3562 length:291 start_codon:yes stop_codon:yes gene_type:complete